MKTTIQTPGQKLTLNKETVKILVHSGLRAGELEKTGKTKISCPRICGE